MAKEINLNVQTRTENDANLTKLREEGNVPAVVYGNGMENLSLKLNKNEFDKVFDAAKYSVLVNLKVDDKDVYQVVIKDVQREVMRGDVIHIDFYQVDMNKKIVVEVPLRFVGEAKAVKELGGLLMKHRSLVNIESLPKDLMEDIEVNLSLLDDFSKKIKLSDLELPENVKVFSKSNDLIANVAKPKRAMAKGASKDEKTEEKNEEKAEEAVA